MKVRRVRNLVQFYEHAPRAFRMNKSIFPSIWIGARRFVEESNTFITKNAHRLLDMGYLQADVMNARPPFSQKFPYAVVFVQRLQQFDFGVACRQKCHINTLFRYVRHMVQGKPQRVNPETLPGFQVWHNDSDVINPYDCHE